jgi:hypothetical protein
VDSGALSKRIDETSYRYYWAGSFSVAGFGAFWPSVPADARKAVEGVEKLLGTWGSLIGPKFRNGRN